MRANSSLLSLIPRIIRAGLRLSNPCALRVVAVGFNNRGDVIDIATNLPRFRERRGTVKEDTP